MSPKKQVISISNTENQSSLLVTASDAGFSLSLENSSDEAPPSPNFLIDKSNKAYLCFEDFCKNICAFQNNAVLVDELISAEHAPIVIFQKHKDGIMVRFCIEDGFKMKVRHMRGKGNIKLTKTYAQLFTSLTHAKKTTAEPTLCMQP